MRKKCQHEVPQIFLNIHFSTKQDPKIPTQTRCLVANLATVNMMTQSKLDKLAFKDYIAVSFVTDIVDDNGGGQNSRIFLRITDRDGEI